MAAERVSHAMHTVPEKPEEAKRREDKGAGGGGVGGVPSGFETFARNRKDIRAVTAV